MNCILSFVVDGFVNQRVKITAPGWTVETLQEALEAGKVVTSIKEGGAIFVKDNGSLLNIGTVEAVDDEGLEFGDFTVDRDS